MNWQSWIISSVVLAAAIPGIVFLRNFFRYQPLLRPPRCNRKIRPALPVEKVECDGCVPEISILIPARNEEQRLPGLLDSILSHPIQRSYEILIMDDQSEDGTASVIQQYHLKDPAIQKINGIPLPKGWCGKQWACWNLAQKAQGKWLLFIDADVRLSSGSIDKCVQSAELSQAALISGIPRQITGSFLERLCIPLIHFVLLSFLPIWRMRRSTHPSYAAGCGQWILVRSDAYHQSGGHREIAGSLHDGIQLPKTLRRSGFKTDLIDLTPHASCRMYQSSKEVWEGLMKNASEGLGSPGRIVPITLILFAGQIAPWILLLFWDSISLEWKPYSITALIFAIFPRLLASWRYRQGWTSAWFHPLGIAVFLTIQWVSLWRSWNGIQSTWRGRSYSQNALASNQTNQSKTKSGAII